MSEPRKDGILITDADQAEWHDYDTIKVEQGLELVPQSKKATEWIERATDSPMTMIDTPLPWKAWRGIAGIIEGWIRSCPFPELRESRTWAWYFCMQHYKNRNDGLRPAHEQMAFMDMMRATDPRGRVDTEATRCLREAIYYFFHNEYLGRQVG